MPIFMWEYSNVKNFWRQYTNIFNPTFVNVKNLNEENVDLTDWGYVTYSIIGCIVVVSFFIVSKKEFEYWHDYEICDLPPCILPKNQGNSPLSNLCVGTCYIQNNDHLSVGCPLIQLNNNSNGTATMYIRALASTFHKAESFRGSFVYLTYI